MQQEVGKSLSLLAQERMSGDQGSLGQVFDPSSLPSAGLMRVQTQYSTAVHVIRPRSLQEVQRRCLEEAAIAGEDFYYSWKQGSENVEGLTVGAALAVVRNFGNCAVDCKVEEYPFKYEFYGVFVDLETGFNLVRPYRQNKQSPKTREGKDVYKGDRGIDIIFQIGASKAIRNVVLNAVPKWLTTKVMETAKENVVAKIAKMGVEKARAMITSKAEALKVALERIEGVYGKSAKWDIESIVRISSALRAIEDGVESIDALFPGKEAEAGASKEATVSKDETKQTKPETSPADEITAKSESIAKALMAEVKVAKSMDSLAKIEAKVTDEEIAGRLTEANARTVKEAIVTKKGTIGEKGEKK